jgi:hypothetical protein
MNISRYFIPCLNFEEGSNIQPDIKIHTMETTAQIPNAIYILA